MGSDITGSSGSFGSDINLNDDGTILAIGAKSVSSNAGQVQIYQFINNSWTLISSKIDGDASGDILSPCALNADGSIVVVGASGNDGPVFNDGQTRVFTTSLAVWQGTTDNSITTNTNWKFNTLPKTTSSILIPNNLANYPTLNTALTAKAVTINSGASFITSSTVTGTVQYRRDLATDNWYMVSSPVVGQDIDAFVNITNLANGSAPNRGLAPYLNNGVAWDYYQNGATGSGNFVAGKGYSIKLSTSGNITFSGTMPTAPVNIPIAENIEKFNLVGNPYPSYLAANTNAKTTNNLLTVNSGNLSESTLWFWDQENNTYNQINLASPAFYAAPGQAFFVSSTNAVSNTVNITEAMQSHQTTDTFQKIATSRPEIKVIISNGKQTRDTDIYYIEGTNTGFDNGYDSSIFTGTGNSFEIFTSLVTNDEGKKLGIQSLPDSDFENMIIPIRIIAKASAISITVNATNLPSDYTVYLEDKQEGTFTKLSETNNKLDIFFNTNVNTTGRFFLHTTNAKALNVNDASLNDVSVYKNIINQLKISGLENQNAVLSVYTILGKVIFTTKFKGQTNDTIPLPIRTTGVYIIKIKTKNRTLSKKIIIE
ncbi:T9SS type A sorting domain-containing protein [uncultured Polaribacter sp.]|uniref:T9SS type A sorting domain-containing protein n=1 Tax=uncultured Polaribacter sp. TaxID=174711 RepID=UPI0026102C69|nr:T9SS type A sorting domain-containing protein [uncultured Polaribacter sp.]